MTFGTRVLWGLYNLKKNVGTNNFSAQFIIIISHYKNIGYNIKQTACWWSTKSRFATLLSSLIARWGGGGAGGANVRLYDGSDLKSRV